MSLTIEQGPTGAYQYKSPFNRFRITPMEPAGKISPGRDNRLQVQMVEKIIIGRDGGRTLIYGEAESL